MKLDKLIAGEHNKQTFQYNSGFLTMFGKIWDYNDIQTLIETANLLGLEGYKIKKVTSVEKQEIDLGIFGKQQADKKIYEGTEEE